MKTVKKQKIISIKPIGTKKTIDLEVDHKDHNFYINGIVSSNSHSASYATLAARTTYLKFKHPKEFFLSLLRTSKFEQDPHSEIAIISKELVYFDIKLLHPDLVKSDFDFSIEGDDIRYGLNSIKGVSDVTLSALKSFRETKTPTKFDVFLAARQAKVDIALLSSLIRAGTLHSYTENRSRLVLEAQCFNKLTDGERNFAVQVGDKYNWDILSIISECAVKNKVLNSKGKPFMSAKRLATFKESYEKYKALYEHNKKHEKFSNWYYENKLLGYSPNLRLKDVFDQPASTFTDCMELISTAENDLVKIVGMVDEVYEGKSKKTNKPFIRIAIRDDVGSTKGLLMDAGRSERLTEFLQYNGKIPEKGDVVVLTARKGKDIIWIESVSIVEDKAYMKTSELKNDEI